MGVGVLGPVQVDDDAARLGNRERVVLAALVSQLGQVVSAERLAEAVWGANPPATWLKSLQGCVSRIRRALSEGCIETTPQGYRLVLGAEEIDAGRFERLLARAEELARLGEPDRAAFAATQALALWRGRPLAELDEWPPGVAEAGRLSALRLVAEELRVDALLRSGEHGEVVAMAQALVESAPSRERRWALLALALYRAGDQAEALRTLRRLRDYLVDELGVEPGPEVTALQQRILRQDPGLLLESAVEVSDRCPYRGLRAYEESDTDCYFGREDEVTRCLAVLEERAVLAVVGPSGIGKSSLVRAGVAAALSRRGYAVRVVVPGPHPMAALDATEVRDDLIPALVVDQAEELYALCADPDERRRFVEAVVARSRTGPVVVALRADRTGDLMADPELARLVERGLFLLGGMTETGLRAAIESPVRQAGLLLEPGLVDLLVREVEREPGALPLLSHVLTETWLRREGRTLTVAGYHASGGIRGAVAQSAEDLFARVSEEERSLLRDLMLRLVAPAAEGDPVPARLPRRLLVAGPAHDRLVDLLVAARLVTSDEGVVEIAHESLTRAWPRLRGWLDEDVEGRRILHHLVAAADAWEGLGRPASELYRGIRLRRVLDWRNQVNPELTAVERDFLDAAAAAADDEEAAAQARLRAQDRMIRRLRGSLAAVAVLLTLALLAGTLALVQSGRAEDSARVAADAETRAVARSVGARAQLADDIPRVLLLAVAAARIDPSPSAQAQLQQVLAAYPALIRVGYGGDRAFGSLAVSPDGRRLAAHATDGRVWLYDAATLEVLATAPVGPEVDVFAGSPVAFSPDGEVLAVGARPTDDLPVRLLDPETLAPRPVQLGGWPRRTVRPTGIAFDAAGRRVAASVDFPGPAPADAGYGVISGEQRSVVLVWDLARPERPIARWRLPDIQGVELSPSGRTVYTGSPFAAYDVATGRRLAHNDEIFSFIFFELSPRGDRMVMLPYGEGGNDLLVVDTRTGRITQRLAGLEGNSPWTVAWSPEGDRVAGTAQDGSVVVWDVPAGADGSEPQVEHAISNQDGSTYDLAFSPDGATLYTAGANRQVHAWDLDGYRSFLHRTRVEETPLAAVRSSPPPTAPASPTSRAGSRTGTTR